MSVYLLGRVFVRLGGRGQFGILLPSGSTLTWTSEKVGVSSETYYRRDRLSH